MPPIFERGLFGNILSTQSEMPGFRIRFWLNILGKIVPLSVALSFVILGDDVRHKVGGFAAGIACLILVEYLGVYRPLANIEEIRRKQFDLFFEPFVNSARFDGTPAGIRVNLMLVRWHWIGYHFFQYYQCGMAGHPDGNFHCSINKGLCGYAFRGQRTEVVYRDLRGDTPEITRRKYKFNSREMATVAVVKAVACIPLYREIKTFAGHVKFRYYGILNVDAIDDAGVELLAQSEIQTQIKGFARFVQISLG